MKQGEGIPHRTRARRLLHTDREDMKKGERRTLTRRMAFTIVFNADCCLREAERGGFPGRASSHSAFASSSILGLNSRCTGVAKVKAADTMGSMCYAEMNGTKGKEG